MAPMRGRAAAWLGLTDATDKTTFDANAARQCADAFKALESKCATEQMLLELDPSPKNWSFYSSQYGETLGAACWAAVRGTTGVGESCTSSSDCEDRGPFSFGDCEPYGTCTQFDFDVALGTACGKYGKLVGNERVVCGSGGYCAFGPDSAIGACAPAKALGESCKSDGENPECGPDAYCDSDLPSQCAALAQAGQPCTPSPSGIGLELLRCGRGLYCDAAASAICVAAKDNGSPCTGDNAECKSARCEAGKCAPLDPEFVVSAQTCSLGPHLAK